LVYLLYPWHSNINKRIIKTPKLYFLDTGLASHLTKWPDAKSLESGAMSGSILETWLFTELLKSYWHAGEQAPFYYYRDTDQKEIDLLIETTKHIHPIEFKKTSHPSKHILKPFSGMNRLKKPIGAGAVFCFIEEDIPLSKNVTAIPIGYL